MAVKLQDLQQPAQAQAGQPVTANAWNVIVDGVNGVISYLVTTEASPLKVTIANTGLALGTVRVTAVPKTVGLPADAVPPVPPATQFVFSGLKPDTYTVTALAPGFDPASKDVAVPANQVVDLTLQPKGAFMPPLFGSKLPDALAALKTAGIQVSRVLDAAGNDVPPANPGVDYANSLVIGHIPQQGAVVPAGGAAQLVVAASLRAEAAIEMPSLIGLTEAEARKALEALGLKLGKVESRIK